MYDVFLSYKRDDNPHFTGRVYDYLVSRGFSVFWDVECEHSGRYDEELDRIVTESPNFILIAEPSTLLSCRSKGDWVRREIACALACPGKKIILLHSGALVIPPKLPQDIAAISSYQAFEVRYKSFISGMEKAASQLTTPDEHKPGAWQSRLNLRRNTFMDSRTVIDRRLAPIEQKFGYRSFEEGEAPINMGSVKSLRMLCYANSLLFTNKRSYIDSNAYDKGQMFSVFEQLLSDDSTTLDIIITAPGSDAMRESIKSRKLGNDALETCPELVFYSTYASAKVLLKNNAVFGEAAKTNRFHLYYTDVALPYALFIVEYRDGFEYLDHVKIDIYSPEITSSMERRTMHIFRDDSPENYSFFVNSYAKLKPDALQNKKLIEENDEIWIAEWRRLWKEKYGTDAPELDTGEFEPVDRKQTTH